MGLLLEFCIVVWAKKTERCRDELAKNAHVTDTPFGTECRNVTAGQTDR